MPRPHAAYSEETKAQAMGALLTGQSVSAVAREYNLPRGTVSRWKADASQRTQKADVGELLLDYLRDNLAALRAQAKVFADPAWLQEQDASQLAVLHGVMTDKAVRLLEAMSAGDPL